MEMLSTLRFPEGTNRAVVKLQDLAQTLASQLEPQSALRSLPAVAMAPGLQPLFHV